MHTWVTTPAYLPLVIDSVTATLDKKTKKIVSIGRLQAERYAPASSQQATKISVHNKIANIFITTPATQKQTNKYTDKKNKK